MSNDVNVRDRFFGCIAGCFVGSAMGAPVEGASYEEIERKHGTLDRMLSYRHYGNDWQREPGTTEDGVERIKLISTAIIEKANRVTAEDVRRVWVRDINPAAPGMVSEPFEGALLAMAKTPIPAGDIGRYCDYSGLVSFARACQPLGLINAGDPEGAKADVFEVGRLYQTAGSRGLQWASVTAVAIASATTPGATVESVLGAVREHCASNDADVHFAGVVKEIDRGLHLTRGCRDFRELRAAFDGTYSGAGIPYALSYANEIVTKAVCIFRMVGGDLKASIVAGVNMGRDTDCVTAVAAAMSGALTGGGSLPAEWVEQVDHATGVNEYTNCRKTIRETSDGLYEAYRARLKRMRAYLDGMEAE